MSQFIIGDIHGCYNELQTLLDKAGIGEEDEIIAIGDLITRGPKPREVFEFFYNTPNARSIQGNHEHKEIEIVRLNKKPLLGMLLNRWALGGLYRSAITYFESMPMYEDLESALITHAHFEPNVMLEEQKINVLLGLGSGEKYLQKHYERPWYEDYQGDKPIIVGHRDYTYMNKVFRYGELVYGIDTRCVYGGALTGILLPEFRIISVPSKGNYWDKIQSRYC